MIRVSIRPSLPSICVCVCPEPCNNPIPYICLSTRLAQHGDRDIVGAKPQGKCWLRTWAVSGWWPQEFEISNSCPWRTWRWEQASWAWIPWLCKAMSVLWIDTWFPACLELVKRMMTGTSSLAFEVNPNKLWHSHWQPEPVIKGKQFYHSLNFCSLH